MLTNLVRELDDHDLSVLHTRNTQNGLVGVACVNPLHKKISRAGYLCLRRASLYFDTHFNFLPRIYLFLINLLTFNCLFTALMVFSSDSITF